LLPIALGSGLDGARLLTARDPTALRALPTLSCYLKRTCLDALLTTLSVNNLMAIWATREQNPNLRVIIREATSLNREISQGGRAHYRFLPALVRRWYPEAHAVVAPSQGAAADLLQIAPELAGKVATIYNPVDVDRIQRLAAAPVEHPWFRPGEPPLVISVGRLEPEKNFPLLLGAFALLAKHRSLRLMILGEGSQRHPLRRLAAELGVGAAVELPGLVDNPFAFVQRAALFVLPSNWEGFPNVLAEALACGCPVVSADCPSGPGEILENGQFGRLVPVNDDAALAEAMQQVLDSPPPSERLRARAELFSVDRAVDAWLDLLLSDYVEVRSPAPAGSNEIELSVSATNGQGFERPFDRHCA